MAPNPVFIQTDDGLGDLDCARFPLAEAFDDVMADFKSVVIDSLDWLERLVWVQVVRDHGTHGKGSVDNIEDFGFAKGYMYAIDY